MQPNVICKLECNWNRRKYIQTYGFGLEMNIDRMTGRGLFVNFSGGLGVKEFFKGFWYADGGRVVLNLERKLAKLWILPNVWFFSYFRGHFGQYSCVAWVGQIGGRGTYFAIPEPLRPSPSSSMFGIILIISQHAAGLSYQRKLVICLIW